MKEEIIKRIIEQRIIAIVRLEEQLKVGSIIESLISAGINVLEITSNTPEYLDEIKKARKKFTNSLIGAGTITNKRLAKEAIECGAQFLVTPNTNADVVFLAHEAGIPVLMGAFTATEIANAIEYDADFIKLFPAEPLGIEYFKTLSGPFNQARFIAVGGIGLSNAAKWLECGITGIGMGNSLTKGDATEIRKFIEDLLKLSNKTNEK